MKRPALRVTIQVSAILALVAVTLVVIGPIRGELERRISALKEQAVGQLEATIGREITYANISPSILRYFAINDLTVHGRADEPADLLTVQRLKIYYKPWELIRGNISEAFSEVRIENTTLSVDTRRDSDLMAVISDIAGSREASGAASLIPDNLIFSGRNIELKVASDIGIARVQNLFFTSSALNDVLSIRTEGDVQLLGTTDDLGITELEGRILASGSVDVTAGTALFDVTVPQMHSNVASLERQVFQVNYNGTVIEARKIQDRNPVDVYVRLQTQPVELYARVLSDGYRLSDLVRLEGEYSRFNQYIQAPVRGQASATITPEGISYAGSLLTRTMGLSVPDGNLTVRFAGDARSVRIDQLDYRSAIGDIGFDGTVQFQPFRPDGEVTLRNVVYGGIAPLSVTGRVRSVGDTISVDTNRFTYAGVQIRNVSGFVTLGENPVSESAIVIAGDPERTLNVTAELSSDGMPQRFSVDARSVLPAELVRLQRAVAPSLEVPDLAFLPQNLVVNTRLSADLSGPPVVDVPLFNASDPDRPGDRISFSLRYSDEEVKIDGAQVRYDGYEGTGDFVARFGDRGIIDFDSDVVVEGIPYQFSGTYDPQTSLEISGLHDVNAHFRFGDRNEIIFSASGDIPLPVAKGAESRLAFDGEGYFFSDSDWAVTVNTLAATGIPYYAVSGADVTVAGEFAPSGGHIDTLTYRDEFSEVTGSGSVNWNIPDMSGSAELVLTDQDGEETYSGSVAYDGEVFDLSAVVTRLPLERLGVETVRGSVSGAVDISGPPGALSTRVAATLRDGRFNGDLVELTGVVNASPESISVEDLSGRYVRTRFENVAADLSVVAGTLTISGQVVQPNENGDVVVGFDLTGTFPDDQSSFAQMLAGNFVARAVVSGLPVREDLPADWQFSLSRSEGVVSILGGPEDALQGVLDANGDFTANLRAPLPLSFDAVGSLVGGAIEADLTNVSADVARLWQIVESPGVTFSSGTATGAVRIVGPLNDPDFYGTLIASNITGKVDIVADLVGPARTYLVFNEKVLQIRKTVAPVGEGTARLSAAVTLDRWLPDEFRVWADVDAGDAIRVVQDFGGVAVDGLAEGSIVVTGGNDSTRIEGNVLGTQMDITLSEVAATAPPPENAGDLIVDVQVTTGRGVQFLWPTAAFPILRGFADAGQTARITHRQSSGSYTVKGSVDIQGGEVFYFDRSFYIKEGHMEFDEDQTNFDPLLTVNAEIRETSDDGPVRIYLVADERPLSQFTPQWRSDPPMPESQIIALLGGNVFVSQEGSPINLSQAVLLTSDLVSQFGVIRGFESTVRDALNLDLFSIRTQLFQNLLRGYIDPLDTTDPSLGKYLNNTTLFMGKYLGTDLFLELLVQLRATDAVDAATRSLAGIAVDSELSLEWQTPFFLLDWSFFPRNPSSLFLTDNTFSFGWDYSY